MKGLVIYAAIAAAMCASCASTSEKAVTRAEDFKAMIDTCTNADSMKVYIDRAVEYAHRLEKNGRGEEARMYLQDISSTVTAKDPAMAAYFNTARAGIDMKVAADSLADVAEKKGRDAADSLKAAAAETAGDIKDAVVDKAEEVAGKTKAAADKAKDAVSSAAETVRDKASEAVNAMKK